MSETPSYEQQLDEFDKTVRQISPLLRESIEQQIGSMNDRLNRLERLLIPKVETLTESKELEED